MRLVWSILTKIATAKDNLVHYLSKSLKEQVINALQACVINPGTIENSDHRESYAFQARGLLTTFDP